MQVRTIVAALGVIIAAPAAAEQVEQGGQGGKGAPPSVQAAPGRANDAATGTGVRADPRTVESEGAGGLAPERAAEIANALMATAPARRASIAATIGAPAPGDADLRPLPPGVADLVPEYRGYAYAVGADAVVIVKPSTRQVVAVIRPNAANR